MNEFVFTALGTSWYITTDGEDLKEDVKAAILEYVKVFENQFSRFLPDSESNGFCEAGAGEYAISDEFAQLLTIADGLRTITSGVYDPGVGKLLERAGYDAKYRMEPEEDVEQFVLPKWSHKEKILTIDSSIVFDFGGIGKGYCIDRVSDILKKFGYKYFLVDAGGDIFATTKKGGEGWNIAIEYPGKPEMAVGTVKLKNQSIAVSDSFRRRWGKWHHLVHPQLKKSVENIIGAVAIARSALDADCMTSAIFFSINYEVAAKKYAAEYLIFQDNGATKISLHWEGELFE